MNGFQQELFQINYRDNKDSIFEEYQVRDGYELANKHYALSLSDQYWLKPLDENISWKDINYFGHDYDGKDFFEATYGKKFNKKINLTLILIMVLEMGFEPTAYWLRVSCSTVGATPA